MYNSHVMDNIKGVITGGIITLAVGGMAFTFSQEDVINNLANDTGLTQEQAEQYINDIPDDEFASFEVIGSEYIEEGEFTLAMAEEVDCVTYASEWELETLTCLEAKNQLTQLGNSEKALGQAYIKLDTDWASEDDIREAIGRIDQLNAAYDLEINTMFYEEAVINELKMTNYYNKSLLKTALESE